MTGNANPEFLRRAISLATQNVVTGRGGPFAAVIVRDGEIVGQGVNTVTASHDPTAHGEVNAIRAAAKALGTFTLAGCELYTSCEPCPMCLAASIPSNQLLAGEAWSSFQAWLDSANKIEY
jgi:guanine deaminase